MDQEQHKELIQRKRYEDESYEEKEFNSSSKDDQFLRDKSRIIHSASFRRLQAKTQILSLGESDFYRTRLTHSLEVAQLGSSICAELTDLYKDDDSISTWLPPISLIEAIGLAHDLGHPPFGHAGEIALNSVMKDFGGFEANGQTLRIATKLGEFSPSNGLDLTRRTLLGLVKYPATHQHLKNYKNNENSPPKCIHDDESDILEWILKIFSDEVTQEDRSDRQKFIDIKQLGDKHYTTKYKSLDCSIMELADDIAYGVHDLEDALSLKLVTQAQWQGDVIDRLNQIGSCPIVKDKTFDYTNKLFSDSNKERKHAISKLIRYFVKSITIEEKTIFKHSLLRLNSTMNKNAKQDLEILKKFIKKHVIKRHQVQLLEFKGQDIITKLFLAFKDNPKKLLPEKVYREFEVDAAKSKRIICDYIACMTDTYATKLYCQLFIPNTGSIFSHM